MFAALAGRTFGFQAMAWAVGIAVVLAGALAATGWLYVGEIRAHGETRGALAAEESARKADADQAAEVNRGNLETITALRKANGEFAADSARRIAARDRAIAELQEQRSGLERVLAAERRARADIYRRDPNAEAWARTAVPAAVADRLRRHAAPAAAG